MGDKPAVDRDQYRVALDQRLAIRKTQHIKPLLRQQRRSTGIGQLRLFVEVLSAIELNDEPAFDAGEVGEVGADWMLASKLVATDATVTQSGPEHALRIRRG